MTLAFVEHNHAISGTIETISWSFDVESEILSPDGKGAMMNFFCDTGAKPWNELTSNIVTVAIADGITTIGNHALISCNHLNTVLIPSCVRLVGRCAFAGCPQWKSGAIGNISGKFGDTTGELSLKGKGEVPNFYTHGMSWHEILSLVKTAVIEDGITSIGDYAFSECGNPASTKSVRAQLKEE